MKLGISSYTYTWAVGVPGYPVDNPLSAFDLVDKALGLGVSVLQIADNLPLDAVDEADLLRLERVASSCGIQLEIGTRGIHPDHLMNYLKLAQRFKSPILRVVVDTPDHHPSVPEVVALLGPCMREIEKAGITLAIENHDRFSVKDLVSILEMLDSSHVGICLDTVNSFGALEGPGAVLGALAPWTVNLHIKDFMVRRADHMMGFVIEGTPAGRGRLDVPWMLEILNSAGRKFNAILELWTPPRKDLNETIQKEAAWAEESIRYLRKHLPE
jgi:sugar phosphate isomerase/epimerase